MKQGQNEDMNDIQIEIKLMPCALLNCPSIDDDGVETPVQGKKLEMCVRLKFNQISLN